MAKRQEVMPIGLMAEMAGEETNAFDAAAEISHPQLLISAADASGHYAAPLLPHSATETESRMYLKSVVHDKEELNKAKWWVRIGTSTLIVLDFLFTAVPALLFIIFVFRASLGPTLIGVLFPMRLAVYIYINMNMHIVHLASATQSIVKNGTTSVVPRFMHVIGALGSHHMFWIEQTVMGGSISLALVSIHLAFFQQSHHSDTTFVLAIIFAVFSIAWPVVQHILLKEVILERSIESYDAAYLSKHAKHYEAPISMNTIPIRKPT